MAVVGYICILLDSRALWQEVEGFIADDRDTLYLLTALGSDYFHYSPFARDIRLAWRTLEDHIFDLIREAIEDEMVHADLARWFPQQWGYLGADSD